MKKLPIFFTLWLCASWGSISWAQLPTDVIYMPKNTVCIAVQGGQTTWSKYWEGQLKRDNQNIGTHITRMIMPMAAIGLSDRMNVLVGIPYLQTSTTQGNLLGERGFQDLSLWLKGKVWEKGSQSLHTTVGFSTPSNAYATDLQPMALGLGATSGSVRLLFNQNIQDLGYVTVSSALQINGNGRLDRDAFLWGNQLNYTQEVNVPDTWDIHVRIGKFYKGWQMEAALESYACLQGDAIRRNDMPAITNDRHQTLFSAYMKYQPKQWGGTLRFQEVVAGRNVGQARSFMAGILYQINP